MTWAADHTQPGYKPDERYGDVTQRDTGHVTVTCHEDMSHVTLADTDLPYISALLLLGTFFIIEDWAEHRATDIV